MTVAGTINVPVLKGPFSHRKKLFGSFLPAIFADWNWIFGACRYRFDDSPQSCSPIMPPFAPEFERRLRRQQPLIVYRESLRCSSTRGGQAASFV